MCKEEVVVFTFLVSLVAFSCNAACYSVDETRVGADAFGVKVAGVRDRIDGAVLLRGHMSAWYYSV
jgi:hypothetical protein